MNHARLPIFTCGLLLLALTAASAQTPRLYDRGNLTAWCIVPFDARRRGPEERADMLRRLGFTRFAYDWRAEHIPRFDEEMLTLKRFGIDLQAFWFPAALNDEAKTILALLERHRIRTELWITMDLGPSGAVTPGEHASRIQRGCAIIRPLAEAAAGIGCRIGLYNHGGWFGEPENMIALVEALALPNVGIVYNFHHGHDHLPRCSAALHAMLPHLYSVNLNGMDLDGEKLGRKIQPLGQGALDLDILRALREVGYTGPVGILGHTMDDAEATLRDNLDGLDWLVPQLDGAPPPGPKPVPRSTRSLRGVGVPSISPAFGLALKGGAVLPGGADFRLPPLTAECRVRLDGASNFNILLACDTKASGAHWEVYTFAGTGDLTVYLPGMTPSQIESRRPICDGRWHAVAFACEASRGRLWLDGELVADTPLKATGMPRIDGGFAVGRLVEGGIGCDGLVDDVRISRGVRPPAPSSDRPLLREPDTVALLDFDDLPSGEVDPGAWEVEDASRRAAMPDHYIIPAARTEELTINLKSESAAIPGDWPRSHGGDDSARWSPLALINRGNVARLKQAWVYRSGDGAANIQCNPVVVGGVIYAPTAGDRIVALDGTTGREIWSFKPGGRPAQRGLVHWDGAGRASRRLFVNAGDALWAVDPANGIPVAGFGEAGRVTTGPVSVAGAVWNGVFVYPGLNGGVFGIDAVTGGPLWTFNTLPQSNDPAAATWNGVRQGANCWGGMAMDALRGIAYVSTGSPKPNFYSDGSDGRNLYANCILAIEAATGRLLWHFQDLRHDIWDLDLAAPPNLVTLSREGRRVDAVAQVTKTGNTFVLDRVTGAPLFPVRMRRAPAGTVPGERTWPYQPAPDLPEPFTRQVFSADDITTRTDEARGFVEGLVKSAAFGWMEPLHDGKPTIFYGIHGGAEWTGAAFDPAGERLFVSANEIPWSIALFQPDEPAPDPAAPPTRGAELYMASCAQCHGPDRIGLGMAPPLVGLRRRMKPAEADALLLKGRNAMPAAADLSDADRRAVVDFLFLLDRPGAADETHLPARPSFVSNGYPKLLDHEGYPGNLPPWGTLNCIDLRTGRISWKVPLGDYPGLVEQGLAGLGSENFGGATVTAGGLVFCAGTPDRRIRAFDADTGRELWHATLPFGGYAAPATYLADGRQYVVIAATGGGKLGGETGDAWVAFSLE